MQDILSILYECLTFGLFHIVSSSGSEVPLRVAVFFLPLIRHCINKIIITHLRVLEHCEVNNGQQGCQHCFVLCNFVLFAKFTSTAQIEQCPNINLVEEDGIGG